MQEDEAIALIRRIAHKLRRPIADTIQLTGLMLLDTEDATKTGDLRHGLQQVRTNVEYALTAIDDLVALLRLQAVDLKKSTTNLKSLVSDAIQEIETRGQERFAIQSTLDTVPFIHADGGIVHQAILRAIRQFHRITSSEIVYVSVCTDGESIFVELTSEERSESIRPMNIASFLGRYADDQLAVDLLYCITGMERHHGSFQIRETLDAIPSFQMMFPIRTKSQDA